MKKNISIDKYNSLVETISKTLQSTKAKTAQTINTMLVKTYWQIGKYIVEFEQDGKNRAVYGEKLLERLAKDLTLNAGKGFSRSNLTYMRKFFIAFPNSETVSHKLSWSHYFEILKSDDNLEVGFYIKQCERENWSVRDLKRGEIEHNDIGQMNMYLNYFKSEENMEDDNEPIGIVLGAYKDHILMEYALEGISNQLFVSKYQLYLPDRVKLQNELKKLMDGENE